MADYLEPTPLTSAETLDEVTDIQIQAVLQYCVEQVASLVDMGYLEEVLSEEEILKRIYKYVSNNRDWINDFLGNNGKTFIALNSAEKFGSILTKCLYISPQTISEIKISTYSAMQSSGDDISDESKAEILDKMGLKNGDKVLIIEDMIDSGNTLKRLVDFMEGLGVEVRIICLFNKDNDKSSQIKDSLGSKLSTIIDVDNRFILGFGMDYEERMFADIPGLYQVVEGKEIDFTKDITLEHLNIIKELKAQRKNLLTLLATPMGK